MDCLLLSFAANAESQDRPMNRFSRDYALVRTSTGQVMAESHSMERLERLLSEYAADDIACEIIKSDLARDRLSG